MAELTPLITAWIRFAEEDWDDALILSRSGGKPRSICFHAQQCIEKLFKAELMRLQAIVPREIPSRKCRDLLILSNRLAGTIPGWQPEPATLNTLTQAALAYLDPGDNHPEPTEDTAWALAEAGPLSDCLRRWFASLEASELQDVEPQEVNG